MKKLLTVEDSFLIKERGLILAGYLDDTEIIYKTGDKIKIVCPDGKEIYSEIAGIPIINRNCFSDKDSNAGILVRGVFDKDKVSKDSIVYLTASEQ